MARLKVKYTEEIAPALFKQFGYKSTMQVPKIDKIIVNVGCGEARENPKVLDAVARDLGAITGQKAVITKAKKSIANFKLREGMPVGCKVMRVCPKCNKATRPAHKVLADGTKVRVCKKCGAEI